MLTAVRVLGVSTPSVYAVDFSEKSIIMDYIEGEQLKTLIPKISDEQKTSLCVNFGKILGRLHQGGVVHGDPTTSNLLVDEMGHTWMIDFGLAEMNATIEMKGVDLHLVNRALETTHWEYQKIMLDAVLAGYSEFVGPEATETIARMKEIRERGRYH
jgi:TP53 regulating kinase-like protein